MINTSQNLLFIATILALCVISFVHIFLFPLYDIDARHASSKTFMDFEQSLCNSNIKRKKVLRRAQCPQYGIITIVQGGRLGNQMWEYASVWAMARETGLQPYIPRCIRIKLDQVFESLSVPTFEEISHCPVNLDRFVNSSELWKYTNQSIVLPKYFIQPDLVLTWVQDIIQEFTIKKKLLEKSQQILHLASKRKYRVFVGVHIRRTDYIGYLWRKHLVKPAGVNFYISGMKYFEEKYGNLIFIIVSDDPIWCQHQFGKKENVYITSKLHPNSPALDLAILASCNHSLFDYGTFGEWGAILSGGETVYFNLSRHSSARIGQLLPKWHTL